jgi:hypothetical protein
MGAKKRSTYALFLSEKYEFPGVNDHFKSERNDKMVFFG